MRISKGDKVKIIDDGCIYNTYDEMAELMHLPRFSSKPQKPHTNLEDIIFTVLIIKRHQNQKINLYGIDDGIESIIINKSGIKLVESMMLPNDLFEI